VCGVCEVCGVCGVCFRVHACMWGYCHIGCLSSLIRHPLHAAPCRYALVSKESHLNMRAACMVLLSNEGRALTFAKTPAMAL
jgi:hypothetical protein